MIPENIESVEFGAIRAVQRAIAFQNQTLTEIIQKLDQLLDQHRPTPPIERGYRL